MDSESTRPARVTAPDFAGRLKTLPNDLHAWQQLNGDQGEARTLLLGLPPDDSTGLPLMTQIAGHKVYWLESPSSLPYKQKPADSWTSVPIAAALGMARSAQIFFYKPGLALDPEFWHPILAKFEIALHDSSDRSLNKAKKSMAWLPGDDSVLLHQELRLALSKRGFQTVITKIPEKPTFYELRTIWQDSLPDFVLSINFRGLDPEGKIFALCQELQIPLAIWLVDNPWNLLAAVTLPWWKKAHLFLTDASFLEDLKNNGAKSVHFCPLGIAPHMWRPLSTDHNDKLLFVGRAAFPGQKSFFSGIRLSSALMEEARSSRVKQADWHWWKAKLSPQLWPGAAGRQVSYGADLFSAQNRARWIKYAYRYGLDLIGDESWHNLLPTIPLLPPIDYYGKLADFYHNALATLNITSYLIPESLSQRHFDVWAAGGFLLSDATRGLDIFPRELVEPISFKTHEEFTEKLGRLKANPSTSLELRKEWRENLQMKHQYVHRLDVLMEVAKRQ